MRECKGRWAKVSKFMVEERRSDHERAKYCKGWRSRAQRQCGVGGVKQVGTEIMMGEWRWGPGRKNRCAGGRKLN